MSTDIQAQLASSSYLAALRADVRRGLSSTPKSLPPKYFYDARGSELFDEITRLPEYYPTRTETAILQQHAPEIAALAGCASLVELGSGTSAKTRLLLHALIEAGTLREFVPFDVDPSVLTQASATLTEDFPGLTVSPIVGDFEQELALPPGRGRRTIAFLGSTIGNLEPAPRGAFLQQVSAALRPGDMFLLGTDLVKDTTRLQRAYDDASGVTAAFNRNVLLFINDALGADFAVDSFEHVARWDTENEWIEMRLRSIRDQQVTVADLDLTVRFAAGEEMRTEISAKFRPDGVAAELAAAGMQPLRFWTDADGDFGLSLAQLRE